MTKTKKAIVLIMFLILFACSCFAFILQTTQSHAQANMTSEEFLSSFTANNSDVSYENKELTFSLHGNASFSSPDINVTTGTTYSAKLNIRNTVMIFLKNETAATKLKLSFKTSESKNYNDDKTKTIDILPNSDYISYYFNLSDNSMAKGYLRGFMLEPLAVTTGIIKIKDISFQREDAVYNYAGQVTNCQSNDGKSINIVGTLNQQFSNKNLTLYTTDASNVFEKISESEKLGEFSPNGTSFNIKIPFYDDVTSRLNSLFILAADGIKVDKAFYVTNYRDFSDNPYAFQVKNKTYDVADYGAKGDGYTDDTAAIQSAIDAANIAGGGKIVLKGDSSHYGKRYMATMLNLKNNVELNIQDGAILWQNPRAEDYPYEVTYGHDITIPDAYWTATAICKNYPFIFGDGVNKVKVTGGGTIRMSDIGGESLDPSDTSNVGCSNRIHIVPLGFYNSSNIEVSDIKIIRNNGYHIPLFKCTNVYLAGLTLNDVTDKGGDGITIGCGTRNVLIDSCRLYVTDDAVVLWSTSVGEKRGMTWWDKNANGDNRVMNIEITHSYITGGHGITFVTWGTDADNLGLQEISDIKVTDNVLANGNTAIAGWFDNPYYGSSTAANGFNGEKNDFSPIKNITVLNNDIYGVATLGGVPATNVISDCGLNSASNFSNGNFERSSCQQYYNDEWTSALAYWSQTNETAVGTAKIGGNTSGYIDLSKENADLYQGLYLPAGEHTFSAKIMTDSVNGGQLFASDSSGNIIAKKVITATDMITQKLTFSVKISGVYRVGIMKNAGITGKAYIDDANISSAPIVENVALYSHNERNDYIESYDFNKKYNSFDMKFNFNIKENLAECTGGFKIKFSAVDYRYYYQITYDDTEKSLSISLVSVGLDNRLTTAYDIDLLHNKDYMLTLKVSKNKIAVYIDGQLIIKTEDISQKFPLGLGGASIVSYYLYSDISSITIDDYGTHSYPDTEYETYFSQDFEGDEVFFPSYEWRKIAETKRNIALSYVGKNAVAMLKLPNFYNDFDLKFDVYFSEDKAENQVLEVKFSVDDSNAYLIQYDSFNKNLNFFKTENGKSKVLIMPIPFDMPYNLWNTVGIRIIDGKINFYLDGILIATAKDSINIYDEFKVSVLIKNMPVMIDNFAAGAPNSLDFSKTIIKEEPNLPPDPPPIITPTVPEKGCNCGGVIMPLYSLLVLSLVGFVLIIILKRKSMKKNIHK